MTTRNMWCPTTVVFCIVVLTTADKNYENKLTKLWSLSSAANSDDGGRTAVVNVTSASITIQPSDQVRVSRDSKYPSYPRYAFKPRAVPVKRNEQSQVERSVYYSPDNKYKSEVLFPGNYFRIAEEKSKENSTQDAYNPLEGGLFQPTAIPLIRDQEFQRRSLDVDEEPLIEKPEGFFEPSAQRRSISYLLGVDDEEEEENEEDGELEEEDGTEGKHKLKPPKVKKPKKLAKYMMPLLLAYKMKYFALVPLMIAGLVLLVGATGLAGFFFALFAAVMGLQKGGY